MAAFIVFLLVVLGLGLASWLGWTADSRDPSYDLGRVVGTPVGTPGR